MDLVRLFLKEKTYYHVKIFMQTIIFTTYPKNIHWIKDYKYILPQWNLKEYVVKLVKPDDCV